ncbi:MAG: DMT family transporter [Actinomycetes bacterium]|jgi:drug/metabolite transporter (DMT)-like permease
MKKRESIFTWIGVVGMWTIGGAIYPVLSDVTKVVAPMNLVFYRSFGSAVLLGLLLLIFQRNTFKELKLDRRLIPLIAASLLFNPGCAATLAWASVKIPGAITALLFGSLPAIATVFGALVGRRTNRMAVMGVVIATIAVGFLIGHPSGTITTSGIMAALLATVSWFAATEVWVTYNPGYSLLLATFMQTLIGALGAFVARPILNSPPVHLHEVFIGGVVFLTFAFATQHFMYLGISSRVSEMILTSFGFVNPLIAAIVGYFFYSQKVTVMQGAAGVILLTGVALVVRNEKNPSTG